jgi:hypothetical protein
MDLESKVLFRDKLISELKEKKQLSDSSIKTYLRNLTKLNKDEMFKNFNFLKDVDVVLRRLSAYKENTKRNYLISIVSVLSLSDKPAVKKLYNSYYDLMMKKNEEINKDVNPNELTDTQEKNWISWDKVKERYSLLEKEVDEFIKNKQISESQYNTLLGYTIFSLYIHQAPRRNKDYQIMMLRNNHLPEDSKLFNYLDISKKQFIFNSYKTSSKYGSQIVDISPELWTALLKYFSHHPNISITKKQGIVVSGDSYFLINHNKQPLDKVNSITRILNKIFDKAIGSSMLRHIFLTDKYGKTLEEQQKDAKNMAHSHSMQKDYIKKPKNIVVKL